jgi:tight adherence protein C
VPLIDSVLTELAAWDQQVLVLVLLFAAVVISVFGLAGLFRGQDPVERRLEHGDELAGPGGAGLLVRRSAADRRLEKLEAFVVPKNKRQRSQVREWLGRAGYRSGSAIRMYYLLRSALGFGLSAGLALLAPATAPKLSIAGLLILVTILGLVGFFLPTVWVSSRIKRRQAEIRDAFPDALDMLLVCVEAGHGLDAALNRVAEELAKAHPFLAEEFLMVGLELRAGKGRAEVLRDLARRADVDEVSAFVTVLIQSDQFGTSIADALRVYASEMRAKRLVRAEEKANKLPVKLALGTIACTIPPVLLIMAGPSVVMAVRTLSRIVE